jgi:glycosyltransferase involved in cell wall biosynthesis
LRWIESLQRQGDVDPLLVCAAGSRLATLGAAQVRTVEVELAQGGRVDRLVKFAKLMRQLRALKRAHRPARAVVAEGCLMAQRHGLFAARALGLRPVLYVPLVSSFEAMGLSDGARLDRKVRGFYRKLPEAWLTITSQQADELRSWSGVEQPVFCLPNTISGAFDTAAEAIAPDVTRPVKALVLGRLEPFQKGLDRLLEHLVARPELARDVHVSFVGEGPYLTTLEAALRDNAALAGMVTLEGWQDAATALANHDVLLMASRFEGVPLVMLEAMASGVPVVATDMPGTRPYLPASCLFQFGDFDRAFKVVRALRDEPGLRETVVQGNRDAFALLASPAAFEDGVRRLTAELNALK